MPTNGPAFTTRKPRFNHVAMSLTPEMLDEEHRKLRADFFGDVFGFVDLPMMTIDRKRQVMSTITGCSPSRVFMCATSCR